MAPKSKFMKIRLLFIVLAISFFGCKKSETQPSVLRQSILLFKDKNGIYLYDYKTKKEKCVFKAKADDVFLNDILEMSNDTLTFGFRGKSTLDNGVETYIPYFYSVDLKTGDHWLTGRTIYSVHDLIMNVKTETISREGKVTVSDTTEPFKTAAHSYKGTRYNDSSPRFFSQHTINGQSVFSKEGNIYYTNKSDETILLVKFDGRFDPKFGSGYFEPRLDPTGKYAVFRYLPGFMKKESQSLQKIDIQTKTVEALKKGEFTNPEFSNDGKFLLFSRDEKEGKSATWISSIYLLDLHTMEERKIGNAYEAHWLESK
jgi:hypothetical protein